MRATVWARLALACIALPALSLSADAVRGAEPEPTPSASTLSAVQVRRDVTSLAQNVVALAQNQRETSEGQSQAIQAILDQLGELERRVYVLELAANRDNIAAGSKNAAKP